MTNFSIVSTVIQMPTWIKSKIPVEGIKHLAVGDRKKLPEILKGLICNLGEAWIELIVGVQGH